ncbi:acyl-CoA dehydrogenase-related protein [Dorcoceras hygrometricum]|uniref:Acyl-CoA dehydrogenase-related protein n=1 Tax=Dorcoceras hygrometricum TaxID=472368 RepID=A0A2Z7CBB7_9LAMI|nr:acyl-CoA dehydrogenase-related protein [Dorcoceras hygrometricum]
MKSRKQVSLVGSRTPQNPPQVLNTLSLVSVQESRIQYLCDPLWFRDTASRGPTTIVAPESQFRTCPSDHVTLAMSLFDLQDVCIAIGSIATLDLPMVVDLIGIYGLKGPYCILTTTNWFLQALSVIPRGSWGDVARRFTMIRWARNPGSTAGRGFNPAGGALGGNPGSTAGRGFNPAGGAPGGG